MTLRVQMEAVKVDLVIYQGSTFSKIFIFQKEDGSAFPLAGKSAKMQIRITTASGVLLELTTENNGIVFDESTGQIDLYISDEDTLTLTGSKAVYDFKIIDGTESFKYIYGDIKIVKAVTK